MDVALNKGFYDYVTEIKSVLPTGSNLVSPLRSSHPMSSEKKKKTSPRRHRPSPTAKASESNQSAKKAKKRSRSIDKK